MFIQTKDTKELQDKLEENKDENIVVHYNCPDCDDEQVTNEEESGFVLEQIKKYNYLVPHINCTECGSHLAILSPEQIQGIELL